MRVDHRLGSENPWPAAPDDCETAALRLTIGGFSAGATLSMTPPLRLRDRRLPLFDCAVPRFGSYDLSARTPAGHSGPLAWIA